MAKQKSRIQALLISYLSRFGSINLALPDGMDLEIGITQEGKHGFEKRNDYCWVVTRRDNREAMVDKYSMSMFFDEDTQRIVDVQEQGAIHVI